MRKKWIGVITAVTMIFSTVGTTSAYQKTTKDIEGSLVMVGGALGTSNAKVYNKFIELAGGKNAKIGIIPAASSKLTSSETFKKELIDYGVNAENIQILPISKHDFKNTKDVDESKAWKGNENNPKVAEQVKELTGIWMVGGDQTLITEALINKNGKNSKALDAMWDMYQKGGVIGGTSAGAAVMSDVMLAGGDSLGTLRDGFIDEYTDMSQQEYGAAYIEKGLGFFEHGIVDQHFDEKARLGRLIMTAYEKGNKDELAYGIDEDTALVFESKTNTAQVVGRGGVCLVDVSNTTKASSHKTDMENIRISYLLDGDTVKVDDKKITVNKDRGLIEAGDEYMAYKASPQTGVLTPYGQLKSYLAYALLDNSENKEVNSFVYDENGVGFKLIFKKDDKSKAYYGTWGQKDVYSIENVALDIKPITVSYEQTNHEGYKKSSLELPNIDVSEDDIKGNLVIAGGAIQDDNELYDKFAELAKGKDAKIGIIPAASSKLSSSNDFKNKMIELGVPEGNVEILPLSKHDFKKTEINEAEVWKGNENNIEIANKIKDLTGIWMVGGDQTHITNVLLNEDKMNSKALDAIWEMYKNGGVLGGSSAGAAVMSDVMLAGGDSLGTLRDGFTDEYTDMSQQEYGPAMLQRGLGFFRYGVVDQHFDQKSRLGRLIATHYEKGNEEQLSYGIDENTAMIVNNANKTVEVVGSGGVMLVDLDKAERENNNKYKDIAISHIVKGDKLSLNNQEITFSSNKDETKGYEYNEYIAPPNTGVMTNHGVLKQFLPYALVDNTKNNQVKSFAFDENGVGFELIFSKGEDTNGYWGYADGQKDDYSTYRVYMDITPIKVNIE